MRRFPLRNSLRPLKYHHSRSQMIFRLLRNQAVNKPPSEDDIKPHWGVCAWKLIHNHSDRAKGSIICFPFSQKFMSDGLAIGAYPLPAQFLLRVRRGTGRDGKSSSSYCKGFFLQRWRFVDKDRSEHWRKKRGSCCHLLGLVIFSRF